MNTLLYYTLIILLNIVVLMVFQKKSTFWLIVICSWLTVLTLGLLKPKQNKTIYHTELKSKNNIKSV